MRDDLLTSRKTIEVALPGMAPVWVRELSIGEAERIGNAPEAQRVGLTLALVICDEAGTRLFGDDEVQRVEEIPARIANQILEVATELNSLDGIDPRGKN